ncbi:MAG: tryptophan--tRNA ligase [bacterium]|nr:tryptophan--tRNA ligase [bacterium]
MKIYSAIQPTGAIHLGNYAGAIMNWVKMQDEGECIYAIANYHSLTAIQDPKGLPKRVFDAALDLLACGLDPQKCSLYVQSHIPEVTELTWILSCCAPMGELNRMTQFKEKSTRTDVVNAGLFTYPVLMASDILLFKADVVPVGEDQLQHLEVARVFARRFNSVFGETFPEPQSRLTKSARIMALNDPTKKMSKSLEGSAIMLSDPDSVILRHVKRAVTDAGPDNASGQMSPGVANMFTLLETFSDQETVKYLHEQYDQGTLRYKELKDALGKALVSAITPIRERREELAQKPDYVKEVLYESARKMRVIAKATLAEVREKAGLGALPDA